MSYDPDSTEAKKGALGEEIVKKYLEDLGAIVTRPDEYGEKTLVDFLAMPKNGSSFASRYVEVKVRSAFPYAHGQYLCYAFPAVKIDAYKKFASDKTLPVQLWIVDLAAGKIFIGNLSFEKNSLENKQYIDCKEFPFDQETKFGLMHYYHQKQFSSVYDIDKASLKRLQNIDCNKPIINNEDLTREAFIKVDNILTAPNGINIDIVTVAGDSRFFVKAARVSSAIGYQNPSITVSSPIIKAADRLQVKYYRFPTRRLSGGDSYGSKAYYFAVEDVPKVLAQYCELHYKAKPATRQGRYNLAAQKLREWFQSTVLPKYSSANQNTRRMGKTRTATRRADSIVVE